MRNIRLAYVYPTKRASDGFDDLFAFWSQNRDIKPLWADAVFVAESKSRGLGLRLKCEPGSIEAANEAGYVVGWDITPVGKEALLSHASILSLTQVPPRR